LNHLKNFFKKMIVLWHAFMVGHSIFVLFQLTEIKSLDAATYATVNVIRSVLPRLDLQRICLFDGWESTPLVGRSLATIAELSFANQLQRHTKLRIVPSIVCAQLFCWLGVMTGRLPFHVVEESIWAFVAARVTRHCVAERCWFFAFLAALYTSYMIFVDVPVYATRASSPVTMWEGLQEMATCRVEYDWLVWREDVVWMTGYFLGATQLSLYLD
jgi:hypothetical protein